MSGARRPINWLHYPQMAHPMNHGDRKLETIIEHYRLLAGEADHAACDAMIPPKFRNAYRTMARHWTELASELEDSLDLPHPIYH